MDYEDVHGTLRPDDGSTLPDAECRICGSPIVYMVRNRPGNRPAYCSPACRKVGIHNYNQARKTTAPDATPDR